MDLYLTRDLILHLILFQAAILAITISNIYLSRRARRHPLSDQLPRVSILVPARNEELNINACILSLLAQQYPDFEVIALNDRSTDQTGKILGELAEGNPGLKVLEGQPERAGQTGKNWACSQLAEAASGELLFFTDADTQHSPQTLLSAVSSLEGEGADLLSGYPRQVLGSWGEKLLVPFFSWAVLVFFPLGLAYRMKNAIFTTAVGQMMLFRRAAYQAIGGHGGVSESIVDDLALARRIQAAGFRWRVVSAADLITCRMYRTTRQALDGFSKNLFAAFEFRLLPYLFAFTWLAVLFLEPLVVLVLHFLGKAPLAQPPLLAVCSGLSLGIWLIAYWHLGIPWWLALCYPATVLANLVSGARSLWLSLAGKLVWKGRAIQPSNWKWL